MASSLPAGPPPAATRSAAPSGDAADAADAADARGLSRKLAALNDERLTGARFVCLALVFAALLWGAWARGAFFRADLIVFTGLCGAAWLASRAIAAPPADTRWIIACGGAAATAVLVSAAVRHALVSALTPLAAILAAMALAASGSVLAAAGLSRLTKRAMVDVATVVSVACWFGVAFHVTRFAALQAEGWRANAGSGYANSTALILGIGLLCAVQATAESGATADFVRLTAVTVGVASTQSRAVVGALALAWVWLAWRDRPSARAMARAAAWAAVAFVGLVPAVREGHHAAAYAVVGLVLAAALSVLAPPDALGAAPRRGEDAFRLLLTALVGLIAAAVALVLLRSRVGDAGSDSGRVALWQGALRDLHVSGFFGTGPRPLADFSDGRLTSLFDHNDVLQYAQYYGVLGVVAVGVVVALVGRLLVRRSHPRRDQAVGVAVAGAIALCALVDFPLQVPIIPAAGGVILAATLTTGSREEA